MLTESKQNIFDLEKPGISQSTRRYSTSSTSACKKMLKSICEDNEKNDKSCAFGSLHNLQGDTTVRQIKLKQTINYLQKKNGKQAEQILMLTQDLNTLAKVRQEEMKNLQMEMQKIKKCQMQKNQNTKAIVQLKKKISELQNQNAGLKTKNADIEKKFVKLKQLLRKKQVNLNEIQARLEGSDNYETIMLKQKQQIASLRTNFIKVKEKQSTIEDENQLLTAKISQYKKQNHEMKGRIWSLEQENKRLFDQCEELQLHYQEQKKQNEQIQIQLESTIRQQREQIHQLHVTLKKIGEIDNENKDNKFCEVYKEQVAQVLRQNIVDKFVRSKMEKALVDILDSMEQSMNRVFMQIVATHI